MSRSTSRSFQVIQRIRFALLSCLLATFFQLPGLAQHIELCRYERTPASKENCDSRITVELTNEGYISEYRSYYWDRASGIERLAERFVIIEHSRELEQYSLSNGDRKLRYIIRRCPNDGFDVRKPENPALELAFTKSPQPEGSVLYSVDSRAILTFDFSSVTVEVTSHPRKLQMTYHWGSSGLESIEATHSGEPYWSVDVADRASESHYHLTRREAFDHRAAESYHIRGRLLHGEPIMAALNYWLIPEPMARVILLPFLGGAPSLHVP